MTGDEVVLVALVGATVGVGLALVPDYAKSRTARSRDRAQSALFNVFSAPEHTPFHPVWSPSAHRAARPVSGRHAAVDLPDSPQVGSTAAPTSHRGRVA